MANRVVFLKGAILDLQWFRIYHENYFPEGLDHANKALEKCVTLLGAFPNMGRKLGKSKRHYFSIPRIPFSVVYEQDGENINVLRVLDQRSKSYYEDLFETS